MTLKTNERRQRLKHNGFEYRAVKWGVPTGMLVCLLSITGCFLGNDGDSGKKGGGKIKVSSCVELNEGSRLKADALVAQANEHMVSDMQYLFDGSAQSWDQVKARDSQTALNLYDQALAEAPGHCGALFGRAVVSAMRVTQDPRLDEFMQKLENSDGSQAIAAKGSRGPALLKMSPQGAAPVLLKLSADLENTDRVTLADGQSLIESTIIPKLDSTIAVLEKVLEFDTFAFEFNADERLYQLDLGDVGPLLAGLKVAKAWMTVAVSYQWDFSKEGKYDWVSTMIGIDQDAFDSLSTEQLAALEHFTGMFKPGSSISRIKPAWKQRLSQIPALLLSAVEDAQRGLRYAIAEGVDPEGQKHDLYVVGTGINADVDPKDLEEAVELLERSKKYLKGEVPITYNKGSQTLTVDFPRLFKIDGIQNLFPYFKFRPYEEWNDIINPDTVWGGYFGYDTEKEILRKAGYDSRDWNVYAEMDFDMNFNAEVIRIVVGNGNWEVPNEVLATLTPKEGNPCHYEYVRQSKRVKDGGSEDWFGIIPTFVTVPDNAEGEIVLNRCRDAGGQAELVEYIAGKRKVPFYFTDAAGNKTLEPDELENFQNDISSLQDKIIFRDPTFGGLFPGLTQNNIWSTIKSLETVKPRTREVCEESVDINGFYRYECRLEKAVVNPSDLDMLISNLYWVGNLMNPEY